MRAVSSPFSQQMVTELRDSDVAAVGGELLGEAKGGRRRPCAVCARNEAAVADGKGTGTPPVPVVQSPFGPSPLIAVGCRGPVKVARVKLDFQTSPFQAG